jgi:phenylacetate-CoA ligase
MKFDGLRIALVGPLPPPSGGMANQTQQLVRLLEAAGARVRLVPVNAPYRPAWVANIKGLRAAIRLAGYLRRLWNVADQVDLFHVMANSGWSWHLFAAPAIWIARIRGKSVIVNYRGGEADDFFCRQKRLVGLSLNRADAIIVPSSYLVEVFARHGFSASIVPNIIDLDLFSPSAAERQAASAPLLLVTRNLEAIYDNAGALHAFALVKAVLPQARLCIAGSGPELPRLEHLAAKLGVRAAVTFAGRIEHAAMAELYRSAALVLNPSLADNMPNSVLEALACGVPVVSTDVGGIPALLQHDVTALLVAPGDPQAMAQAALALLQAPASAHGIAAAGHAFVQQFGWPQVAPLLLAQYRRVLRQPTRRDRSSNWYSALVSTLLFPLHERIKGHSSAALRQRMEQSQWHGPQQLRAMQLERLRALLLHAGAHVPYYRALFERLVFDPSAIRTLHELARLPLLTKADIRAHCEDFKSDLARDLARFNTGGSSGEPLVFYIGKQRVSHDVAAKWRATRWWGVDIGDRELVVWGSPIELQAQDRLRAWRDALFRTSLWPAFQMSQERLDQLLQRLRKMKPSMLFGYPSALSHIARHAKARHVALDDIGLRVAFVTAERLYDEQRTQIGAAFGCPVANGYGGRDAGFIAHECPQGGMHITAEDIIVEVVDAQGLPVADGQPGAIVITHLATGDFPFIRYVTGDVGVLDSAPCTCGRGLPLLKQIEGRSTDFVVAQDGTVMHGLALIYILRDLPQIQAFKIIQETLQQTRLLIVACPALGAALRETIAERFKARLGASVNIVIDEVQAIPPEASGKFRYVVSKVAA